MCSPLVVLFLFVIDDAVVKCIPTCATPSSPAKYGPVLAGDYLMQKHLASQAPTAVAHAAGLASTEKKK
jgi:hypothetical protein